MPLTLNHVKVLVIILTFVYGPEPIQCGDQAPCSWTDGAGKHKGVCVPMRSCNAAISDYVAGLAVRECEDSTLGKQSVCCPLDDFPRISERKCTEYMQASQVDMILDGSEYDYGDINQGDTISDAPGASYEPDVSYNDGPEYDTESTELRNDRPDSTSLTRDPHQSSNHRTYTNPTPPSSYFLTPFKVPETPAPASDSNPTSFVSPEWYHSWLFRPRTRRQVQGKNLKDSQSNYFPYMVGIDYETQPGNGRRVKTCSGTLISESFVLTAAKCVTGLVGKPIKVFVGNRGPEDFVPIKRVLVHPSYDEFFRYGDIALLQLKEPITISASVRPICLPSPKQRLELVRNLRIVGLMSRDVEGSKSTVIQTATLQRENRTTCAAVFDKVQQRTGLFPQGLLRSQICIEHASAKVCQNSLGGPAIATKDCKDGKREYIVGITSSKSKTFRCQTGKPGIYTNVQSYLTWIESNVWPEEILNEFLKSFS